MKRDFEERLIKRLEGGTNMPRRYRTHVLAGDTQTPAAERLAPKHLTKAQFANRLYKLMLNRGWHQSELARQSGLPRDSISTYMRGQSLPTATSLAKLATVFDMSPEELLPNHVESAIDEDQPSLEFRVSAIAPNTAWLRVNRLVSVSTGAKIIALLEADDVTASQARNRSEQSGS